jgi:hypothetical protein
MKIDGAFPGLTSDSSGHCVFIALVTNIITVWSGGVAGAGCE